MTNFYLNWGKKKVRHIKVEFFQTPLFKSWHSLVITKIVKNEYKKARFSFNFCVITFSMTYFSSISHISLGLSFKRALSTKAKGHGVFFEGIQNHHHPLSNVSVFEVHNFAYCAQNSSDKKSNLWKSSHEHWQFFYWILFRQNMDFLNRILTSSLLFD